MTGNRWRIRRAPPYLQVHWSRLTRKSWRRRQVVIRWADECTKPATVEDFLTTFMHNIPPGAAGWLWDHQTGMSTLCLYWHARCIRNLREIGWSVIRQMSVAWCHILRQCFHNRFNIFTTFTTKDSNTEV